MYLILILFFIEIQNDFNNINDLMISIFNEICLTLSELRIMSIL